MSKILVVDDEKSLRLLYKRDLEAAGYSVVTAGSAAEALRALESESPDLVVLDIRLPGMDGLEAMGRMLDRHPMLPVVLNTAYASYRDNFLSWSADSYLVKSSDTSALRVTIHELLEKRRTAAAVEAGEQVLPARRALNHERSLSGTPRSPSRSTS